MLLARKNQNNTQMAKVVKALKLLFSQTKLLKQEKIVYVGKDNLGNKYYEQFRPSGTRINRRYFERDYVRPGEDFVDLSTSVPPAWDAWLRYRRQTPPSAEEIEESENYFKFQQALAAKNKEEEEESSSQAGAEFAPKPIDDKFPRRKDYELRPHEDPKSAKHTQDPD